MSSQRDRGVFVVAVVVRIFVRPVSLMIRISSRIERSSRRGDHRLPVLLQVSPWNPRISAILCGFARVPNQFRRDELDEEARNCLVS